MVCVVSYTRFRWTRVISAYMGARVDFHMTRSEQNGIKNLITVYTKFASAQLPHSSLSMYANKPKSLCD